MTINGKTNIYSLIGNPVSHSFSPRIHNYLFDKYNMNNVYVCFKVEKNNFNNIKNSINTLGIKGCNVTIPYKVDIIKHLDGIDKNSKLIGSVNTIKVENNKLWGFNTDGVGFVKSIEDRGYNLKHKKVMIIGAGGSCRSIAVELASKNVESIEIRNRSTDNAKLISESIKENFNILSTYSSSSIRECDLENIDILINTTPVGMDNDESPIDTDIKLNNKILVCDIVYSPHETTFLKWAKSNNQEVIYGIDMLVNQAIEAFKIWTGIEVDECDREYLKQILTRWI